jgi:hypothetical protein
MIDDVKKSWAWRGIYPKEIIQLNAFGNVILKDKAGKYWRISPEELDASVIADSEKAYSALRRDKAFMCDWEMANLVKRAEKKLGPQPKGRCFCLKVPGVLGGSYTIENIGTISIKELIHASGDLAKQIEDMPDGAKIKFKIVD